MLPNIGKPAYFSYLHPITSIIHSIKNLRTFASFLLQENHLDKAVKLNIKAAREHQRTILDKLGPLTEEEITQLFTKSLGSFLKDIADHKGPDNIIDSFNHWKKSNYGFTKASIGPADIILGYEIRKDVLIKMIPLYTVHPLENIQLREEIDALFFIARKTGMSYLSAN